MKKWLNNISLIFSSYCPLVWLGQHFVRFGSVIGTTLVLAHINHGEMMMNHATAKHPSVNITTLQRWRSSIRCWIPLSVVSVSWNLATTATSACATVWQRNWISAPVLLPLGSFSRVESISPGLHLQRTDQNGDCFATLFSFLLTLLNYTLCSCSPWMTICQNSLCHELCARSLHSVLRL